MNWNLVNSYSIFKHGFQNGEGGVSAWLNAKSRNAILNNKCNTKQVSWHYFKSAPLTSSVKPNKHKFHLNNINPLNIFALIHFHKRSTWAYPASVYWSLNKLWIVCVLKCQKSQKIFYSLYLININDEKLLCTSFFFLSSSFFMFFSTTAEPKSFIISKSDDRDFFSNNFLSWAHFDTCLYGWKGTQA